MQVALVFEPDRAQTASDYLRIAACTVWAFECLQTLAGEVRIYRAQRPWSMTIGCKLFVAVRYLASVALITSAVGFFGHGYSSEFCSNYQRVAPLFKVFSALANQAVFLWRTYAISGRRRWVLMTLVTAYTLAMAAQFFANSVTIRKCSDNLILLAI
jgi:hypothetical protein